MTPTMCVCGYLAFCAALVGVFAWMAHRAPELPVEDEALREDRQVAFCEAIPLPEPWSPEVSEGLRILAGKGRVA